MTLIELLVTMTILATIVGGIAGAFAIGFHVLSAGNTPAQLTGNNDLIAFEQQIGADVNRAVCLAAPGQQTIPLTPPSAKDCSSAWFSSCAANPTGYPYQLCLGWYLPGSPTCHTVTYTQRPTTGVILRSDAFPGNPAVISRVGTGGLQLTATWTAGATSTNSYFWTTRVVVTVIQAGSQVVRPQTATFRLLPLAADPQSPAMPGSAMPC